MYGPGYDVYVLQFNVTGVNNLEIELIHRIPALIR